MKIEFPIVKPVLPVAGRYPELVQQSFDRNWLTNNGPHVQELTAKLSEFLGVEHLLLVANGTLALQLAYRVLGMHKAEPGKSELPVLTTPFSFAATASSLAWQGHDCLFSDIDAGSLNLCPTGAEQAIKDAGGVAGIVATHVFGNPSTPEALSSLANALDCPLIYDAAHAFGCEYKGQSLLNFGDISTLSLHATKIFHTVEGGALVFKRKQDLDKARELINFGFDATTGLPTDIGFNAKMSEVHAAMGLALLPEISDIQARRIECTARYQQLLADDFEFQIWHEGSSNNGAYMPILCRDETQLKDLVEHLTANGVQSRRYFYPSLSEMDCYGKQGYTPIANDISRRILCLPLYGDLTPSDVDVICQRVKAGLR